MDTFYNFAVTSKSVAVRSIVSRFNIDSRFYYDCRSGYTPHAWLMFCAKRYENNNKTVEKFNEAIFKPYPIDRYTSKILKLNILIAQRYDDEAIIEYATEIMPKIGEWERIDWVEICSKFAYQKKWFHRKVDMKKCMNTYLKLLDVIFEEEWNTFGRAMDSLDELISNIVNYRFRLKQLVRIFGPHEVFCVCIKWAIVLCNKETFDFYKNKWPLYSFDNQDEIEEMIEEVIEEHQDIIEEDNEVRNFVYALNAKKQKK
jgi:hypothetical protein